MATASVLSAGEEIRRYSSFSAMTPEALAWELAPDMPTAALALYEELQLAAECDAPVLVCGETDNDAERLALWIHRRSARGHGPFLVVDAALRELQSALFDSIRGLLTTGHDASDLIGRVRGGTLFIPHIEEMSPAMQVALLHFLELPEVRSDASVRLIAATDRFTFERVQTGQFCEELYYLLNVIRISMPAATSQPI